MVKYQYLLLAAAIPPILYIGYKGLKRKQQNQQVRSDNISKNKEFNLMQSALQLQLMGQNQEAIKIFDQIIQDNDKDYLVYYLKAESLTALQQFDDAIINYKKALEIEKGKEVYLGLGNAYQKKGQCEDAIQMYDKCIEIDPRFKTPYFNKGITYQYMKDFEKSLESFDQAISMGLKEGYIHKGLVLQKLGKIDEAIEEFNKLINKYNDVPQYYQYKAIALVQQQKYRDAIKCLDKMIELDPKLEESYIRKESLLEKLLPDSKEELEEFQIDMLSKDIEPQVDLQQNQQ